MPPIDPPNDDLLPELARPNLIGSITVKTDNLELASKKAAESFQKAIAESAAKLGTTEL